MTNLTLEEAIQKYIVKAKSRQHEVQELAISVTQGYFKLEGNNSLTKCIPWNCNAATIQSSLNAISSAIGPTEVDLWKNESGNMKFFIEFRLDEDRNFDNLQPSYFGNSNQDCAGAGEKDDSKVSIKEFLAGGVSSDFTIRPETSTQTKVELRSAMSGERISTSVVRHVFRKIENLILPSGAKMKS